MLNNDYIERLFSEIDDMVYSQHKLHVYCQNTHAHDDKVVVWVGEGEQGKSWTHIEARMPYSVTFSGNDFPFYAIHSGQMDIKTFQRHPIAITLSMNLIPPDYLTENDGARMALQRAGTVAIMGAMLGIPLPRDIREAIDRSRVEYDKTKEEIANTLISHYRHATRHFVHEVNAAYLPAACKEVALRLASQFFSRTSVGEPLYDHIEANIKSYRYLESCGYLKLNHRGIEWEIIVDGSINDILQYLK